LKKFDGLGRSLSKDEQKKIVGGNEEDDGGGGYSCFCRCPSGTNVVCPGNCNSSECFDRVYSSCNGQPASWCVTG